MKKNLYKKSSIFGVVVLIAVAIFFGLQNGATKDGEYGKAFTTTGMFAAAIGTCACPGPVVNGQNTCSSGEVTQSTCEAGRCDYVSMQNGKPVVLENQQCKFTANAVPCKCNYDRTKENVAVPCPKANKKKECNDKKRVCKVVAIGKEGDPLNNLVDRKCGP